MRVRVVLVVHLIRIEFGSARFPLRLVVPHFEDLPNRKLGIAGQFYKLASNARMAHNCPFAACWETSQTL